MVPSCFGPSKLERVQTELGRVQQALRLRENELVDQNALHRRREQEALSAAGARAAQLEARLRAEQQERAQQQHLAEQQRLQMEARLLALQQDKDEQHGHAEQRRAHLEARLAEEQLRFAEQQQLTEQQTRVSAQLQRRLQAEEQRSKRLTKQITSFTTTMEEVSKVLVSVEHDNKPSASGPARVDRKSRSSAADQLRQSLALFKRAKEEDGPDDQGKAT